MGDDIIRFGLVLTMSLAVGTFVLFMIPIFLRNYRKASMVGREAGGELDELRAEVDELRGLAPRMAELEERLDFAERLLSNRAASEQLREASADDAAEPSDSRSASSWYSAPRPCLHPDPGRDADVQWPGAVGRRQPIEEVNILRGEVESCADCLRGSPSSRNDWTSRRECLPSSARPSARRAGGTIECCRHTGAAGAPES